jgi:heme oxygenase
MQVVRVILFSHFFSIVFPIMSLPSSSDRPSSSSCPYAISLEEDESSSQQSTIKAATQSCPAFSGQTCPFAQAHSPEEIQQTLLQIPASHYDKNSQFRHALQKIHTTKVTETDFGASPPIALNQCPLQSYLKSTNVDGTNEVISFAQAMEGYSLAAIMSHMAQDLEENQHLPEETRESGQQEQSFEPVAEARSETSKSIVSLSQAFKQGTAQAHQAAEDVHFVKNFVQGKIDRQLYGELVGKLYFVYETMEQLLNLHAPKHFPACHFPQELSRTEALREDVDFWHGTFPKSVSPAAQDYIDRLHQIAQQQPLLLLSHAYTRYLGDLSGGKVLARVARRALHLDQEGLAFYDFPLVPSAKRFKDDYRHALDTLPLSEDEIHQLVQEANIAFLLNMRLFEELDVQAKVPGAAVRDLHECLAFLKSVAGDEGTSDQCPFLVQKKQVAGEQAKKGRCPWPFILLHDPRAGLQDYKTWLVLGLVLCWIWSLFNNTVD